MGDARLYEMPVHGMHAYEHAYEMGDARLWRYAYEMAYGGCPSMGGSDHSGHEGRFLLVEWWEGR
jgi:hypothetical protein